MIKRTSEMTKTAGRWLWQFIRRMERNRLVRVEILVIIVIVIFHAIPDGTKEHYNRWLLVSVGACYLTAIIGMLWFTRKWTLRGSSIVSTFQGDTILYLGLGFAAFGYVWEPSLRTDAVRASFVIGGPLLVWSVAKMFWDRRRGGQGRRDILADDVVFASLAAAMPVVVACSDGIIISTTPAFEDLIRSYPGELNGVNLTEIMPSRYRERHLSGLARYLQSGKPGMRISRIIGSVVSVDLLRRDGTEIPVSLALTAADVDGKTFFIGAVWDREEIVSEGGLNQ